MNAIILSGGNSTRMNYPKAFLKINEISLVEKLCNTYITAGIKKPIIILNHTLYTKEWSALIETINEKAILIKNSFPEKGRTFSIQLGLSELKSLDSCFIQNIDNPEINAALLQEMSVMIEKKSYVVPLKDRKGGHPILLDEHIISYLKNKKSTDWILKDELKFFKRIEINSGDTDVLLNINSPNEWNLYVEHCIANHKNV